MSFEEMLAATVRVAVREEVKSALKEAMERARPQDSGEFLSVAEAAELAHVDPKTIRAWMKAGRLRRYYAGRELRVRREELLRLLATPPGSEAEESAEALSDSILGKGR